MKSFSQYSEEIYKCSKCGLCQSVCPVFEQTGLECAVSRGKFLLLNGVIKGDIEFSPKLSEHLDLCLNCNACSEFCPSNIDAETIIISARQEGFKLSHISLFKRFVIDIFSSKNRLNMVKRFISLYRFFHLSLFVSLIAPLFGRFQNRIILFNSIIAKRCSYKNLQLQKDKNIKIVYFPGCINNYINPSAKNAFLNICEKSAIDVMEPEFSCCGVPVLNIGDVQSFKKLAKQNIDMIIDLGDFDYLVTDCASCGAVWQKYIEAFDGEYKQRAIEISKKAINATQFFVEMSLLSPTDKGKKLRVTYHDPCHLKRNQGIYKEPREILKALPGVEYVEMKDADKCCGASGLFCFTHEDISKSISRKKAQNIIDSGVDIVVTSCPSCEIGLKQGLLECGSNIEVKAIAEVVNNV